MSVIPPRVRVLSGATALAAPAVPEARARSSRGEEFRHHLLPAAAKLVALSAAAGATVAALALPATIAAGAGTRTVTGSFYRLPSVLAVPPLLQTTRILAADGSTVAVLYRQNRVVVPLAAVPPVMRDAILDTEDARFYTHGGVDFRGAARALVSDLASGHAVQGGSTITQQYVKNVLVESARTPAQLAAATADTMSRKVREARYALAVEKSLTKDQILERYLNIVFFGDGVYGVGTASLHYFGVPVSRLTLPQAALLAGLVENPSGYNPRLHRQAALARRAEVLSRMVSVHDITPAQAQAAAATPLRLRIAAVPNGCVGSAAPFFCDWVVTTLLGDPALGGSAAERLARLQGGGLSIHTTLDPTVQRAAQSAVDTVVPSGGPVAAAADVVVPGTGMVRAMAVDRIYGPDRRRGELTVNLATGGSSGYQAGSTFKPFVLAAALSQGISPDFPLYAPQTYTSPVFTDQPPGQAPRPYSVSNAGDSEAGMFTLSSATWDSVNTYYLQLEQRTGLAKPAAIATAMGVRREDGSPVEAVPSFTLGTNDVSPLAMAGAYATFADHGTFCAPYGVTRITDSSGRVVENRAPHCSPALDRRVDDEVVRILQGVIDGPDPYRTGASASIGRPAAGKTGTTDGFSAAWFDGFTPQLATAVWMGNPAGGFAYPLHHVTIGGQYYDHVYGGMLPAQIFVRLMTAALAGVPPTPFALLPWQPTAPTSGPSPIAGTPSGNPLPNPLPLPPRHRRRHH